MNVIELSPMNYKKYFPTDLLACTYAYPGAMGEGGAIEFFNENGEMYHLNYCRSYFKWSDAMLNEMFPFNQCKRGTFSAGTAPEPWKAYYMGCGNFLYIHDSIVEAFEKRKPDVPSHLYKELYNILTAIIEETK